MPQSEVAAAGAVVTRRGKQVLLIHRPRYDDWSFPKGKVDPGEHVTAAAVREVAEETGVRVRLGTALSGQSYAIAGDRRKRVHYWMARAVGEDDVGGWQPNDEVDQVRWVDYEEATELLTYDRDRATLRESARVRTKTRALVVLRHGDAFPREHWEREDQLRPLAERGTVQAQALVPLLAAYDVTTVACSASTRCIDTVSPYAARTGIDLTTYDALSEEGSTPAAVGGIVETLLGLGRGVVLCTHRPVLPRVFEALGLEEVELPPAGSLVVHHRKGTVLATEPHDVG
jgi:8-oxo-dGTP pyrophosphatase MutT (NUDIX family)/phosphohistidine phosphatase SixA